MKSKHTTPGLNALKIATGTFAVTIGFLSNVSKCNFINLFVKLTKCFLNPACSNNTCYFFMNKIKTFQCLWSTYTLICRRTGFLGIQSLLVIIAYESSASSSTKRHHYTRQEHCITTILLGSLQKYFSVTGFGSFGISKKFSIKMFLLEQSHLNAKALQDV